MWNREIVELLLVQYGQKENLYNVRHPDYQDRVKRSKSLFEIYECLKDVDANVTTDSIKLKLHSLRTQYLKEVRKVAESKRSGIGQEDVYEPKLWCYDQMKFLKNHISSRSSSSNISDEETYNYSDNTEIEIVDVHDYCSVSKPYSSSVSNENEASTSQQSTPKPYRPDSCSPRVSTSANKRKSMMSDQINGIKKLICKRLEEKSDYEYLSKQVEFEFKSIHDDNIRRETAWKIQNILREAVLEDVNKRNSTISVQYIT